MKQYESKKGWASKLVAAFATVMLALLVSSVSGIAVDKAYAAESGTLSDSVSWSLDDSGNLTIYPTNGVSGSFSRLGGLPWQENNGIITVTASPGVTLTDSAGSMFSGCQSLTTVDFSALDMSSVTDMSSMFRLCNSLTSVNLSGLSTSSVTNMSDMFFRCGSLTSVNLSGLDTSSFEEINRMFAGCTSLETISVGSGWTISVAPFEYQSQPNFYRVDNHSNAEFAKSANLPTGVAATYSVNQYTAPAAPSISVNKTINVPASVDLTGLTYTFDFQAAAVQQVQATDANDRPIFLDEASTPVEFVVINGNAFAPGSDGSGTPIALTWSTKSISTADPKMVAETGAFAVPTITPAQAAASGFDSTNQASGSQVDIPTITLTASNSTLATGSDSVRTVSGSVNLPDPNLFGHAGVYAYTVSEVVSGADANDSWDNDLGQYKVRLYVVNDGNGGLTYASGNGTTDANVMTIEVLKDIDGNDAGSAESSVAAGYKAASLDFTNTYDKTVPFQVKKTVEGSYANRNHKFSFDLTLDFPDYVTSGSYAYTTSYGGSGTVTISNGQATVSNFLLAADETLNFTNLPVGTVYSLTDNTPADGVNKYVPSATYTYSGIGAANSGFESHDNPVQAGSAGASYTVTRTDGTDQNLNTILGAGANNAITVNNALSNPPAPTGVLVSMLPFAAILAIPAILAAGIYVTRRREDELV